MQGADFDPYEGRTDALGQLLSGDGQFAAISTAGYQAAIKGEYGNATNLYHFALVVAYGVDKKYFQDTSYGATGYFHRPYDSNNEDHTPTFGHCMVTGEYYTYTFFRNHRTPLWGRNDWLLTTRELAASGGWPEWESNRWRADEWRTAYPPPGCDY